MWLRRGVRQRGEFFPGVSPSGALRGQAEDPQETMGGSVLDFSGSLLNTWTPSRMEVGRGY